MNKKKILGILLFWTIVLLIGMGLTKIFSRKESLSKWNDFYAQEKQSIDVIILGSSLSECAIEPYYLSEKTNSVVYNLSIPGQTTSVREYFLKEVLKTQSPKIVIVETYRYLEGPAMNIDTIANSIDGMKFSANKLEMMLKIPIDGNADARLELFVPLLASHGRWNSLHKADFLLEQSNILYRGFGSGHLGVEPQPMCTTPGTGMQSFPDVQLPYIDSLIQLAEENNIQLLFFNPPNPELDANRYESYNAFYAYLDSKGVDYLDCNYDAEFMKSIDTNVHFSDYHHVNVAGASLTTDYLAQYLNENYAVGDGYLTDAEEYEAYCLKRDEEIKTMSHINGYLMYLYNDNYECFVAMSEEYANTHENAKRLLAKMNANKLTGEQLQLYDLDVQNALNIVVKNKKTSEIVDIAYIEFVGTEEITHIQPEF